MPGLEKITNRSVGAGCKILCYDNNIIITIDEIKMFMTKKSGETLGRAQGNTLKIHEIQNSAEGEFKFQASASSSILDGRGCRIRL